MNEVEKFVAGVQNLQRMREVIALTSTTLSKLLKQLGGNAFILRSGMPRLRFDFPESPTGVLWRMAAESEWGSSRPVRMGGKLGAVKGDLRITAVTLTCHVPVNGRHEGRKKTYTKQDEYTQMVYDSLDHLLATIRKEYPAIQPALDVIFAAAI